MATLEVLAIGLLVLNALQMWFWWREVHRLIDKVMSKNYSEYVTSKSYQSPKLPQALELTDDSERQSQDVLNELNGMLST